jgi:hypothetical protein
LRATIQDISATSDVTWDNYPGDIRNAKVKFTDREGSDISGWLTPVLVNPSDPKTGVVSYVWEVNIGTATDKEFTVGIIVDGYYKRDNSSDNTVVTVYKPTGDFITGGGYIINPTSTAGIYAGDPGRKTNFGFNVKYNKKGTNLQGNMNYLFRRTVGGTVHTYQIKANAMTSLGVNIATQTAVFISKANLTDITNPLTPVSLSGNLKLQVNMTDNGEPGLNDKIAISLWDGSTLWYSSNWTGTATTEMLLGGGNLVVHSSFSVGTMTIKSTDSETVFIPQAELGLKVYPNPFTERLFFDLRLTTDSKVRLEIFDMTGGIVATVFDDNVFADESYFFEFTPEKVKNAVLMYRLIVDGKVIQTGKVIHQD